MDVKLLALYPLVLNALRGQPGVSLRRRRERIWTQVECGVESKPDGRCYAQPSVPVGSEAGHPTYRLRIDLERGPGVSKAGVAIPLQPEADTQAPDPEQRVLAPIFVSAERVLFEFQRADVLFVAPNGVTELRHIAVDLRTGEVGARTLWQFDAKFMSLIARSEQHIGGLTDMFPVHRPRTQRRPEHAVPRGGAKLGFDASMPSTTGGAVTRSAKRDRSSSRRSKKELEARNGERPSPDSRSSL